MKPQKIRIEMSTASLDRMSDMIRLTEGQPGCSFLLQVESSGSAKGLYLPDKEAAKVQEVLQPLWDMAVDRQDSEDFSEI